MRHLLTGAVIVLLLALLPTGAQAQGGAAVNPVTVDGVSVYPALYSAQYRSTLAGDGSRGADARPGEWWRFLGTAGGCVTIRAEATDFTPRFQVRDGGPNGHVLHEGRAPLTITSLPDSSWYYVRAGAEDGRSGPYTLVIDRC
jgi:hypothetical protein